MFRFRACHYGDTHVFLLMILNSASENKLKLVHPDLQSIVRLAAQFDTVDFIVIEGMRTLARQKELFAAGATRTMNSRHLTGHAIDLAVKVAGQVRWDWPLYTKLAEVMKLASLELLIRIEWGGDWKRFRDGPHFQLPWTT